MATDTWRPTCHNEPRPSPPKSYSFPQFKKLPLELRSRIWELATPGPRLIEVYPKPYERDARNRIKSYSWYANKCGCASACHSPLALRHTCQEARHVASNTGEYSWAFETWVNWKIDIIYIGERVGHLHNAGFLNEVEAGGGLQALKTLAIDEDVWIETFMFHGMALQFKRCGPCAILEQLRGLETLYFVGRSEEWRDGNEIQLKEYFEDRKSWIWHGDEGREDLDVALEMSSDSDGGEESDESDESTEDNEIDDNLGSEGGEDQELEETSPTRTTESSPRTDSDEGGPGSRDEDFEDFEEDTSSTVSEVPVDLWHCSFPHMSEYGIPPQVHNADTRDDRERRFGPTGDCGLALVDFSKIPTGPNEEVWEINDDEYRTGAAVLTYLEGEFQRMKEPRQQLNDEDHQPFIDWTTWVPPKLKLALCRRTAKSCYVEDWDGLENDWISPEEAEFAIENPDGYAMDMAARGYYFPGFLLASEWFGVEGPSGEVRVPKIDREDTDKDKSEISN